jgi:hypothetical protein
VDSGNIPTFSIPRPSTIYPNWDFWSENKPSGNPGGDADVEKVFFAALIISAAPDANFAVINSLAKKNLVCVIFIFDRFFEWETTFSVMLFFLLLLLVSLIELADRRTNFRRPFKKTGGPVL